MLHIGIKSALASLSKLDLDQHKLKVPELLMRMSTEQAQPFAYRGRSLNERATSAVSGFGIS